MYTKRIAVLFLAIIGLLISQPSFMLAQAVIDVNSSDSDTLNETDQLVEGDGLEGRSYHI